PLRDHGADDTVVGQHRHDDPGVGERCGRVGRGATVLLREAALALLVRVADDEVEARLDEVVRHGPAHHPEPDEADPGRTGVHQAFPAMTGSMTSDALRKPSTAAGTPQ